MGRNGFQTSVRLRTVDRPCGRGLKSQGPKSRIALVLLRNISQIRLVHSHEIFGVSKTIRNQLVTTKRKGDTVHTGYF